MMTFPRMVVPLFINREPRQMNYSTMALEAMLVGLMGTDLAWLANYPKTPSVYAAGVRYVAEPPGEERWQSIPAVIAEGRGDCEDLASWRAAELRNGGVAAKPAIIWRPVDGAIRAHAFVILPDGSTEDPSERLGMGSLGLHRPGQPWAAGPPRGLWRPTA